MNVLLAIPTSILGTFIVMYFFNFTLNTFTVLGLTLVVGIVVDDAIMVLENIYRHREGGEGKVIEGTYEAVSGKRMGPNERAITYTKGGKAVLTASQDNILRLWDRETGKIR